ncbi:MAG: 50S ribosomal protein L6, partial [Patescibacteria group bacterium]
VLEVGFSHDVDVPLPTGITATVEKNILTLSGIDNVALGQFASRIRLVRKPEPYGGKGIKYTTETVRRKAGKTAKTGE